MAMFTHTLKSGIEVDLRIRKHRSTQKITMGFYDETIRITAPSALSDRKIGDFLINQDSWIEHQYQLEQKNLSLAMLTLPKSVRSATEFPFLGEMVPFRAKLANEGRLDLSDGVLTLWTTSDVLLDSWEVGAEMEFLLKNKLVKILSDLVPRWAEELGVTFTNYRLSSARKRWGSCSSRGRLNFNWRLIFVPDFVIEAVVIHEVCHLLEMNHSCRFKELENRYNPRLEESDRWLREHGWSVLSFELC